MTSTRCLCRQSKPGASPCRYCNRVTCAACHHDDRHLNRCPQTRDREATPRGRRPVSNTRKLKTPQARAERAVNRAPSTGPRVGRENAYRCEECGGLTVTVDVDPGTTPASIACRATVDIDGLDCTGRAWSLGYPGGKRPAHVPDPAWEWYRPNAAELRELGPADLDYVRAGGLLLRRRSA